MTVFASLTDIQTWLEVNKIQVDDANSQKANIDATRIIKGQLAGFFEPVVIASWADPDSTPEIIRSIAGRLTASFMYSTIYSEETASEVSPYAQLLYAQAMMQIAQIEAGTIVVVDDNGDPIDTTGSGLLSFWPDDTTTGPAFTMDGFFA